MNDSNFSTTAGELQRESLLTINRPNLLNSIKQKCMDRLTEHRKSAIQRKRQEAMHSLTESKAKQGYIEKQVHDEMVQENLLGNLIRQEMNQDLSIDETNRQYEEIYNELNEYMAQQLIESTTYDESYHYERYQNANHQETELIAQTYDPNNNGFYICAFCKRYIYRVRGTKVCCERPGCIDIDLRDENFKLEDLMNMIMRVLLDHREQCESQGRECCQEDKYLKCKVAMMSEVLKTSGQEEDQAMNGDSLALFVTCDSCGFLDFVALY